MLAMFMGYVGGPFTWVKFVMQLFGDLVRIEELATECRTVFTWELMFKVITDVEGIVCRLM